jgi:putative PIN family toxin of toxin-antitoxin system
VLAVFDPNILISALITPRGIARRVVRAGIDERFAYVASPRLLSEFDDVAQRPKIAKLVTPSDSSGFRADFYAGAQYVADPMVRPVTRDPKDDYLIALAEAARANHLVTGDGDLLDLSVGSVTITSLRQFANLLGLA